MGKPDKIVVPPAVVPNPVKGAPVPPVVPVKNSNKKKKR